MKIYLVGGAIRDSLMDLPVKDRDWVVVGSNPDEMLQHGFTQVGKDFPVFLHQQTKDEYALARTETKTGPGHTGFKFDASAQVTLEEDLSRRDLTINAIAAEVEESDRLGNSVKFGKLIDPYKGALDLKSKVLRHVSPAFNEDPLRVLRVARFAARLAHRGFTIAPDTQSLMTEMTRSGELDHLVKERVWQEMEAALKEQTPVVFFQVLRDCGALQVLLPEIDNLFGVPQPPKYHPEIDTGIHTFMSLEQATRLSEDPVVRFASLVHDVGKAATDKNNWPSHRGHESLGLALLDDIKVRLGIPKEYAEIARLVCEHHTKLHRLKQLRASTVLSLLEALDAFRRPQRLEKFLLACEADAKGRTGLEQRSYPQGALLRKLQKAAANIDIKLLVQQNSANSDYGKSRELGELIRHRRGAAIDLELTKLNTL